MSDDPRAELIKLLAETEQKLSAARDLLTLPMDSTVTLRCVELVASLKDSLRLIETELGNLESEDYL